MNQRENFQLQSSKKASNLSIQTLRRMVNLIVMEESIIDDFNWIVFHAENANIDAFNYDRMFKIAEGIYDGTVTMDQVERFIRKKYGLIEKKELQRFEE